MTRLSSIRPSGVRAPATSKAARRDRTVRQRDEEEKDRTGPERLSKRASAIMRSKEAK